VDGLGPAGDDSAACGSVVRAAQLDADRRSSDARVHLRGVRAERLREHRGRSAVEQAIGLGVALDRHRRHGVVCADLDELDAHALEERPFDRRHGHGGCGVSHGR